MADETYFIIETKCPHCGARLVIEQRGDKPKPDDRVVCPTHGFMGARDEIAKPSIKARLNQ
jgi:nitrite reductase/ring-hydroxylating ferredoxin subunit